MILITDLPGCGSKRRRRWQIIHGPRAVRHPLATYPLLAAQRLTRRWPRTLVHLDVAIVTLLLPEAIEIILPHEVPELILLLLPPPRAPHGATSNATFGAVAAFASPQPLRGCWLDATLRVGRANHHGGDKFPVHLGFCSRLSPPVYVGASVGFCNPSKPPAPSALPSIHFVDSVIY